MSDIEIREDCIATSGEPRTNIIILPMGTYTIVDMIGTGNNIWMIDTQFN